MKRKVFCILLTRFNFIKKYANMNIVQKVGSSNMIRARKLGFTLIELLAVIVVLAIVLAIAVPSIAGVIDSSRKSAFESDAKMVLKAVEYKKLVDESFDPTTITKENMQSLIGIDGSKYGQVVFTVDNNIVSVVLTGLGNWNGLYVCGNKNDMIATDKIQDCGADIEPPVLTLSGADNINIGLGMPYIDAGATATDNKDGDITSKVSTSNLVDTSTIGTYTVTYNVSDKALNAATPLTRTVNVIQKDFTYNYTGASQTFTVPGTGKYKIELWGAQGTASGRGAYTSGEIVLSKDENIYIYVGQGNLLASGGTTFNGGAGTNGGYPGGGATDVRLVSGTWNTFNSLKSRIMVAAGSGSGEGNSTTNYGYGGALTGGSSPTYTGASQTGVGNGNYPSAGFGYAGGGCAGGNGYYGSSGAACASGAGGGSSFISGYTGCNAISSSSTSTAITHTGQPNHYSGEVFTNGKMIAGNATMPTHDGSSTMTGNQGNGYARITYLGDSNYDMVITINGSNPATINIGDTYADAGVTAVGPNGVDLTSSVVVTGTVNPNEIGTYTITYAATDAYGNVTTAMRTVKVTPIEFFYTGDYQTFTVSKAGIYKIDLWGASGGTSATYPNNSMGAYTSGEIFLSPGEKLYIYVGQTGDTNRTWKFNGGAYGGSGTYAGYSGGGATDVRLVSGVWDDATSLRSRIMVAAAGGGGGGRDANTSGGYAGALTGSNGVYYTGHGNVAQYGKGGTQTAGGVAGVNTYGASGTNYAGSFGKGGYSDSSSTTEGSGGGGGGYYGGGSGGGVVTGSGNGAGGGSSFISGYTGCNAINESGTSTGQPNHYSGKVFESTVMKAGNESMPTKDLTSTMTGNKGNGYARITLIAVGGRPVITLLGNTTETIYVGDTYTDAGATATDYEDGDLTSEIVTSSNVNPSVVGTYTVTYTVTDSDGNTKTLTRTINVIPLIYTYSYTGNYQTFTVTRAGNYKVELWGASGAVEPDYPNNGKGAYTKGEIHLDAGQILYIYVGQTGDKTRTWKFNGGAYGGLPGSSHSGGGATDIRLASGTWDDTNSLRSRIMVAAGGGGAAGLGAYNNAGQGGFGGALTGLSGTYYSGNGAAGFGLGGTQTAGGAAGANTYSGTGTNYAGSFGKGGQSESTSSNNGSGGGGGGYYGGGAGGAVAQNGQGNGAGGGSSFISGHTGCNAVDSSGTHTGQPNHYSGLVFTSTVMTAGNATMPTLDGTTTMTGNKGNGYAKLTYIY